MVVSAALLAGPVAVRAAESELRFDIPAQPLSLALERFSRQTGWVAAFDGHLAEGRVSAPVHGDMAPRAALTLLLGSTGLVADFTADDAFVVVPRDPRPAATLLPGQIGQAALSTQSAPERRFSAQLQHAIASALCSDPVTRPGAYRAAISIQVDAAGATRRVRLLSSTGDARRDAAIMAVATGLAIGEPPPPGMSQPFAMVLLPGSSGGRLPCAAPDERG